MIQISHLYKTYPGGAHALRDIDLDIGKGEFVFLTGPSGAGKTTLFRMICAFDKPTSGRLQVGDFDLGSITAAELPDYRQRIGVVFQDFRLLKNRTIFDNVALPLLIRGDRSQVVQRRVCDMLDLVGLGNAMKSLPDQLSGGEQQRAAIARALIHQPGLLIADEPTGNLDPDLSEQIIQLLERISAQGTTVVVATHDHELVKRRHKRQLTLFQGKVVGDFA